MKFCSPLSTAKLDFAELLYMFLKGGKGRRENDNICYFYLGSNFVMREKKISAW